MSFINSWLVHTGSNITEVAEMRGECFGQVPFIRQVWDILFYCLYLCFRTDFSNKLKISAIVETEW